MVLEYFRLDSEPGQLRSRFHSAIQQRVGRKEREGSERKAKIHPHNLSVA